jgi:2-methylisocitrate lyase-like PEP mutase family enzyme
MTNHNFKTRLARNDIVLAPGVYDALSALVAEQAGFEALYLSGASIAYTRLGRSDIGLTTQTEVADTLARITERVSLPVIVDADTGFGNALNTQRTVRGFERAGAAMVQIEDQTFPKRCGHLDGKAVVPVREMVGKLKAALDARASADTLILARTDAVAVEGLDAALDRAEAYLECGVDALFIEALRSPEQMDAACAASRTACRCWPTWSKAARRRSRTRTRCTGTAFASRSFRAARRARWCTRCRATTRACTSTAPRSRGARRCSTSTGSTR